MLPILLALATALAYGIADFLTGLATRRAPLMLVMLLSQGTSTILTFAASFAAGGTPSHQDYVWGAWSGVVLLFGLALLVFALRHGRMSEIIPVISVISIAIPILFSIAHGTSFRPPVYTGIALAVFAIVMINQTRRQRVAEENEEDSFSRLPLLAAFGTGIAFGAFNTFMFAAATESSFWIVTIASVVRLILLLLWVVFALARWGSGILRSPRGHALSIAAGTAVSVATITYLAALQNTGDLAIVNVVSSQATIVTVLCAWVGLREKIYRPQAFGLAASFASIALIAYYA